ncbi:uracil-DNA glycosylase family protein [Acuticoccus sp. I52.16.1]|uniref:uracil-DNA glycosylase family protein n=1 Tax=Acuticoccus sp. I52.16.1 TaxID=2928472 RepID=UPI001FD24E2B|nr:uracil-DNA glycosylase family protein [Acuticoccus sp. I52.16.1]UOM34643.1 uracil-DNA glycosylase family protein [Acuticoccus sp. I52.16.1]
MTGRPPPADVRRRADDAALAEIVAGINACDRCVRAPVGPPLPQAPRPVFQLSATARIAVCGQAPGNLAHRARRPFFDPSGVRLRGWMGVDEATFYDASRIAVIPMGFCFPGLDKNGGDRPPRRECRATWHDALFAVLPRLQLLLCIGRYALDYHLPATRRRTLTDVVASWREIAAATAPRTVMALPHPSWRNNAWLRRNPWFEAEQVPELRARVAALLAASG